MHENRTTLCSTNMLLIKFLAYELLQIPNKYFLLRHPNSKPLIRDLRNKTDILKLFKPREMIKARKLFIIIIIIINCNWVITRWQWLLYMYTNMKKSK